MKIHTHTQDHPSKEWIIKHDLASNPMIEVMTYSSAGTARKVYPIKIEYRSLDEMVVNFQKPINGVAQLC